MGNTTSRTLLWALMIIYCPTCTGGGNNRNNLLPFQYMRTIRKTRNHKMKKRRLWNRPAVHLIPRGFVGCSFKNAQTPTNLIILSSHNADTASSPSESNRTQEEALLASSQGEPESPPSTIDGEETVANSDDDDEWLQYLSPKART